MLSEHFPSCLHPLCRKSTCMRSTHPGSSLKQSHAAEPAAVKPHCQAAIACVLALSALHL